MDGLVKPVSITCVLRRCRAWEPSACAESSRLTVPSSRGLQSSAPAESTWKASARAPPPHSTAAMRTSEPTWSFPSGPRASCEAAGGRAPLSSARFDSADWVVGAPPAAAGGPLRVAAAPRAPHLEHLEGGESEAVDIAAVSHHTLARLPRPAVSKGRRDSSPVRSRAHAAKANESGQKLCLEVVKALAGRGDWYKQVSQGSCEGET